RKRIITVSVPIRTNEKLRESRLFSSIGVFITRSISIMVRVYSSYRAMKMFAMCGLVSFGAGVAIGMRFLYYFFFTEESDVHVQSLILAAILLLAGFQMILTGIVADLINSSRATLEDVSYRLRRMELEQSGKK
ncbi:MAG: glycosyltransferase family 2 protein, partial [Planctomycetota bacterium]|nr:glycosyltransferase family 2 protein [Planctomycetota bacterium]